MSLQNDSIKILVPADEQAELSRILRAWLQRCPDKPLERVDFEYLGENEGLTLSTIQAAFKTRQFIGGSYEAQYQFKIIYRTIATTADERLRADEVLDQMGAWAEANTDKPQIADNIRVKRISRDTQAALFDRYEGDVEDHQILMKLIYEVNK